VIVEDLESKVFQGVYAPGLVRIRPGLNVQEKSLVLKHELAHHRFYSETLTGRLCSCFFRPEFTVAYMVFMFLFWLLSPVCYALLIALPVIDRTHEIQVSIKYPSYASFSLSVLMILALLGLFWLRLRV
jgi:hypothetical protein